MGVRGEQRSRRTAARQARALARCDGAQVGVGGAAAAAATVLVVVAAGHGAWGGDLLGAAGELEQTARDAAIGAVDRMTPTAEVLHAVGRIRSEGGPVDELGLTLRPYAGNDLDLREVVLRLADGARDRWIAWGQEPGKGLFTVLVVRDADGSVLAQEPVLTKGDLVELRADLRPGANDFELPPRTEVRAELVGDRGAPVVLRLATPGSYGSDRVVELD